MIWSESDGQTIRVNVADQAELLADLRTHLKNAASFSVATLNLDHVVKLSTDTTFRNAYAKHTHVTADGNPIVWLTKLAGQPVSLVPGSELIEPLAALAADIDLPIGLLGSTEESLQAAADNLRQAHPGLQIPLIFAPPMGFDPEGEGADDAIKAIQESGARIVFVALGAPKQEVFAAYASTALNGVGFLSIGAGLDFISGHQRRAPAWVRAVAAEWLWRLLANPTRLARRYAACILVLPGVTLRALRQRFSSRT